MSRGFAPLSRAYASDNAPNYLGLRLLHVPLPSEFEDGAPR